MKSVPPGLMSKAAASYAKQIRDAGRETGIEAVVVLVSKRDGRVHWASTLSAHNAGEVLRTVASNLRDGDILLAPASALREH